MNFSTDFSHFQKIDVDMLLAASLYQIGTEEALEKCATIQTIGPRTACILASFAIEHGKYGAAFDILDLCTNDTNRMRKVLEVLAHSKSGNPHEAVDILEKYLSTDGNRKIPVEVMNALTEEIKKSDDDVLEEKFSDLCYELHKHGTLKEESVKEMVLFYQNDSESKRREIRSKETRERKRK